MNDTSVRRTKLQRIVGLFLTLALVFMALPSKATWQCLDGTPCALECAMQPLGKASHINRVHVFKTDKAVAACSRCLSCPPIQATSTSLRGLQSLCTSSTCVLRVSEHPASVLQSGMEIHVPTLALPPPVSFEFQTTSTVTVAHFFSIEFSPPQRFLRPSVGRAPPVLL